MDDYIFVYKNSTGYLSTAINPRFIAKHQSCIAIPKEIINDSVFETYSDFISELNSTNTNIQALTIVDNTDLREIYYQ